MLDLETMGTRAGAAIVSIGAAVFGPEGVGAEFYVKIDWRKSRSFLRAEPATLKWWAESVSPTVRAESEGDGEDLLTSLRWLAEWAQAKLNWMGLVRVWANGPSFDFPILGEACRLLNVEMPWRFHQERCFRTLRDQRESIDGNRPKIEFELGEVAHHALHDARAQARCAAQLLYPSAGRPA